MGLPSRWRVPTGKRAWFFAHQRLMPSICGHGRLASFLGYATRLRSLTQGQGEVMLQPDGYVPVEDGRVERSGMPTG